jgi:hypothetical protein
MTTPTRTPGRYGRRAPKNAPALRFADIRRAGVLVPPHPVSEDYLAELSNWRMLDNDRVGCCVAATWANFRRLVTALLASEVYPTDDQVIALYKTQNPDFDINGDPNVNGPGSPADGGMDIQTLLEYLVATGGPDGVKALAFAKVDYTNEDELFAALAIFGGVWTGVTVTQANQDEFSNGQPWDYVPGSPQDGGHSVLSGGYGLNDVRFITWAAETSFTQAFVQHQVDEAWIVIWPEHLGTTQFEAGIDQAALAQAYQELTGRPFPAPVPVPAPPVPGPGPSPQPVPPSPEPGPDTDPVDLALVAVAGPWANEEHLTHTARAVARAIRTWRQSKGL